MFDKSANEIDPTVIIKGDEKNEKNNKILPYTVLKRPLEIGGDDIIGPHLVIGFQGLHARNPRYVCESSQIKIDNRNIIREFVAILKSCYEDITVLKDGICLKQSVHIPHDPIIEGKVEITQIVSLADIARILEGLILKLGCSINQHCVFGQYYIRAIGLHL